MTSPTPSPARLEELREQIAHIILGPKSIWNYGAFRGNKLEEWPQYPETVRALAKADAILVLIRAQAERIAELEGGS